MRTLCVLLSGCAVSIALLAAARPAAAAGCQTDVEKLCKNEKAIVTCLQSHKADLSAECSAYLAFFEQIPSCLVDAQRLCPSDKPSGAGVIACLRGRQSDLSDDCRKEIGKLR